MAEAGECQALFRRSPCFLLARGKTVFAWFWCGGYKQGSWSPSGSGVSVCQGLPGCGFRFVWLADTAHLRRHLTREQRDVCIRDLRARGMTLHRIAEAARVSVGTAHAITQDVIINSDIENSRGQSRPVHYAPRSEPEPERAGLACVGACVSACGPHCLACVPAFSRSSSRSALLCSGGAVAFRHSHNSNPAPLVEAQAAWGCRVQYTRSPPLRLVVRDVDEYVPRLTVESLAKPLQCLERDNLDSVVVDSMDSGVGEPRTPGHFDHLHSFLSHNRRQAVSYHVA